MSQENTHSKALLELGDILVRYKWHFVFPAFVVMVLVLGVSMFLPRKYKAEATFERRWDMVLEEVMNRGGTRTFQDPRQGIGEELVGKPAIDRMIDSLKEQFRDDDSVSFTEQDFSELRYEISKKGTVRFPVSNAKKDRIVVEFVSVNPILARAAANALVENYIRVTREQMDSRLNDTSSFFGKEVDNYREKLEDLENKKLEYELTNENLLPSANIDSVMTQKQSKLKLEKAFTELEIVRLKIDDLKKTITLTPETMSNAVTAANPVLTARLNKLAGLEANLDDLVNNLKMMAKHPDVLDLKKQIIDVKKGLASLPKEVVIQRNLGANPKYTKLVLELDDETRNEGILEKQIQIYQKQVKLAGPKYSELFPVRSAYRKLTRDIASTQREISFWEDNLRRVNISKTAESGDRGVILDFIKPCGLLSKPVSPQMTQVITAAMALGLLFGCVSLFFAHRTDETFLDGESLSDTFNLPLVGSVSELITTQQLKARRLRRMIIYPINTSIMLGVLIFMVVLVYVNFEQPGVMNEIKKSPGRLLGDTGELAVDEDNAGVLETE